MAIMATVFLKFRFMLFPFKARKPTWFRYARILMTARGARLNFAQVGGAKCSLPKDTFAAGLVV